MKRKMFLPAALILTALSPLVASRGNAAPAAEETETQSMQFPNAKIDAKAKAALDAMRKAYTDTKTFRGEVSLRTNGFPDRPRFDMNVKFQRDDKIAIRNVSESGTEDLVANGTIMQDSNTLYPGMYLRGAAPKPTALVKTAFGYINAQNTVLFRLLSKSSVLGVFGSALKSVRLGTEDDTKRARELAQKSGVSLPDTKDAETIVCEYSRGKNSGTVFYILGKPTAFCAPLSPNRKAATKQ